MYMEKNKYQRASKNTKKEIRMEFFQTDFGKSLNVRLIRLVIFSILLIGFAIYFLIDGIFIEYSLSEIISAVFFIIFAIIFLWGRHYIIVKNCNNYMINNPKKEKTNKKKK